MSQQRSSCLTLLGIRRTCCYIARDVKERLCHVAVNYQFDLRTSSHVKHAIQYGPVSDSIFSKLASGVPMKNWQS